MGRMQLTQASAIEELADLDQVLGNSPVLADTNCESLPFEAIKNRCQDLKKICRPQKTLDSEVEKTKEDLEKISEIEKSIAELEKSDSSRGSGAEDGKKNKELIQLKKLEIEMIQGRNPVLTGEIFKKEKNQNLKLAVENQLKENRNNLTKHLTEVTYNHLCLTGTIVTRSCSAEKVRNFVEKKTPRNPIVYDPRRGQSKAEALAGSNYMSFQECLHDAKVDQLKTDEILSSSALNAALTISTVGLGSAFAAGKVIQTARQIQLAQASKIMNLAAGGISLGSSIQEAGTSCLSNSQIMKGELKLSNSACQIHSAFSSRIAVKEFDDCVLQTSMAALGLLPFAGSAALKMRQQGKLSKMDQILSKEGVSKEELALEKATILRKESVSSSKSVISANAALSDEARAQKISKDFKNLKQDQVNCVVKKVHPIGGGAGKGVYNYSSRDIALKARTLRRTCQIGVEETEALLRLGYAGELPTEGSSELLRLLNKSPVLSKKTSHPSIEEIKIEVSRKIGELASSSDPLKKIQLKDEIKSLEQEMMAETIKENPKLMDQILKKASLSDSSMEPTKIGDPKALILSSEKRAQLEKRGVSTFDQLLIEVKPGDQVLYKSFSFGNGTGKIKGPDPEHPGNLIVEIMGNDSKKRTVSMFQTDIAMSEKEKAESLALLMKENQRAGEKDLQKLLEGPSSEQTIKTVVDDLARQASKTPKEKEVEALQIELQSIQAHHGKQNLGGMLDPGYERAAKRYRELTSLSPEEDKVLRALNEINLNSPKANPAELKVIVDAKKIRDAKSENKLSGEAKEKLAQIDKIEKQIETAPQRYVDRQLRELSRINDSPYFGRRYDFPSQKEFQQSFAPSKASLGSREKQDYQAMGKLFTEDPQLLSDKSSKWLRQSGSSFYSEKAKLPTVDPQKDYFIKRLKIYLEIEKNR